MRPVKRIDYTMYLLEGFENQLELTENEEKESSEITTTRGRIIIRNINGSANCLVNIICMELKFVWHLVRECLNWSNKFTVDSNYSTILNFHNIVLFTFRIEFDVS